MIYNDINFNNKTVLITGGAGFIGSNLAFYIQKNFPDCHLVVFDCFRNGESRRSDVLFKTAGREPEPRPPEVAVANRRS